MNVAVHLLFVVGIASANLALAQAHSPYAGQQHRDIKSLSAEDVDGYLSGKGMGLARAAELNGYPGPMHVLELAERLDLSAEQLARTQALFDAMQRQAIDAGRALLDEERALDDLFRSKAATPARLEQALARVAQRHADVRRVHLAAHIAQIEILRPDQVRLYDELRGYGGGAAAPHPQGHGAHRH